MQEALSFVWITSCLTGHDDSSLPVIRSATMSMSTHLSQLSLHPSHAALLEMLHAGNMGSYFGSLIQLQASDKNTQADFGRTIRQAFRIMPGKSNLKEYVSEAIPIGCALLPVYVIFSRRPQHRPSVATLSATIALPRPASEFGAGPERLPLLLLSSCLVAAAVAGARAVTAAGCCCFIRN